MKLIIGDIQKRTMPDVGGKITGEIVLIPVELLMPTSEDQPTRHTMAMIEISIRGREDGTIDALMEVRQ